MQKLTALLAIAALLLSGTAFWQSKKEGKPSVQTDDVFAKQLQQALKAKPEIIIESLNSLRNKQAKAKKKAKAEEIKKHQKEMFENLKDPVGGNPKGDVQLVQFFDYRCGYCRRAYGFLKEAVKKDGNIKVIYKEFPVLGHDSLMTKAALAAHMQNKYEVLHEAFMTSNGRLDKEDILDIAGRSGLDVEKLKKDIDSETVKKHVEETVALAEKIGVEGTPSFIIGGESYAGALSVDGFLEAFKAARQK